MNGCQDTTQVLNHQYAPASVQDVSLQFSSYSSDVVCTCFNVFPKPASLTSVQVVYVDYFLVEKILKNLHPTECEHYLTESPPLADDRISDRQYYSI